MSQQEPTEQSVDECEQELQRAYEAWRKTVQKFSNHLEMFKSDVERSVASQGKGYLILTNTEEWLDTTSASANEIQNQVKGILSEAQQALSYQ